MCKDCNPVDVARRARKRDRAAVKLGARGVAFTRPVWAGEVRVEDTRWFSWLVVAGFFAFLVGLGVIANLAVDILT